MHPVLFSVFGFSVYAYGILVALACMVASFWAIDRAKSKGWDENAFLSLLFAMFVVGFVGARLLYWVYNPSLYLQDPLKLVLDRGGFVWYGGLIAGGLAVGAMALKNRWSILTLGDIISAPAAVGLAIGRVGCFLTGCCYGKETTLPWGVLFPVGHPTYPVHVHPSQLYETMLLLVLLPFLIWAWRKAPQSGVAFGVMCLGMGLIRFAVEWTRGDGIYWVGQMLTASQTMSLGVMALGLLILVYRLRVTPGNVPAVTGPKVL